MTCTIPTPGRRHGGTGAQRATVSGPGLQWPRNSILDYPFTGRGPLPVSGESRRVTKTSQISGISQNEYLGTDPKICHFSRIEFRWDFIPGRDLISVRLSHGLRKLPKASRSLQRARIREDARLPQRCRTPPEGPDQVFITTPPSRGVVSCVAFGLPGHPPKGGVARYFPVGLLRGWSRCFPTSGRRAVSLLTRVSPHRTDSENTAPDESLKGLSEVTPYKLDTKLNRQGQIGEASNGVEAEEEGHRAITYVMRGASGRC